MAKINATYYTTPVATIGSIPSQYCLLQTHWGQDEMGNILQTTFSNVFSSMKMCEFRLKFHWFVPKGQIDNIPALVQMMVWRCPGDKPLSEPMMVNLPTHICITWPQWVMDANKESPWHQSLSRGCINLRPCNNMAGILQIAYLNATYWKKTFFWLIYISQTWE